MNKLAKPRNDDPPLEHELDWYHQWAVLHRRMRAIASDADADLQHVRFVIERVDDWMRAQWIEDPLMLRRRHSETLEQLASDCVRKWQNSDQINMAEQARKFLADLRRLWNIDTPEDAETEDTGDAQAWVPGMTRIEAIRRQIEHLQGILEGHEHDRTSRA